MKYAIGIDLGGTKIEGVLIDEKGRIKKKVRVPTEANKSKKKIIGNIATVVKALLRKGVVGVGIGTPGFVVKGKLTLIKNVPKLMGVNLAKEVSKATKIKNVVVANDANCFALAENKFGAGKKTKNMLGVIIGTGFGMGIIIDGKIYAGSKGGAGEIGHMTKSPTGPYCTCGKRGHLEAFASGPAIVKRYDKIGGAITDPDPAKIFKSKEIKAKKIVDNTLDIISITFANLISSFDPQMIVVGGGVSNINFYSEIRKRVKKYVFDDLYTGVRIVKNKLGDSSGVLGAAALVLD